jgi:uncharacterized protein involved in exopolysaccharide biosynthesis
MTNIEWVDANEELSIYAVAALLLRNRWRILRWAFAGALLTLAFVWTRPSLYRASASFIPQGADSERSSLASIAGQFGVSLPSSSQSLTPDFYLRLLKSPELLGRVARDTVVVPELGGRRVAMEDLLEIDSGSAKEREEGAVKELTDRVVASASKTTSVVDFSASMKWPSVSLRVVRTLLDGVNDFNLRIRRDQASAERKFVEERLAESAAALRLAEDRLQQFLQSNRQLGAPDLQFTRDRLQREVSLRQQVFTSLTQSYEEVRMREVRDTPVITIVDEPHVPSKPIPRGRGVRTLLGFIVGALVGSMFVILGDRVSKRRAEGDAAADEFVLAVGELKGGVLRSVRKLRGRAGAESSAP